MLRANDRRGIANVIEYPLLTEIRGKKTRIFNRANFLKHYDEIFDKGVRCAILGSSADDVWGNSHGFSVDHNGQLGAIWFDDFSPPGVNEDTKAPDFWTRGTFAIMTVNNGPYNHCTSK
jgi:hypothetical protein